MGNDSVSSKEDLLLSLRPYLVAGWYEWCIDKDQSPRILVQVDKHCVVPQNYVDDEGRIVFNISATATADLLIQDTLSFKARFSGASFSVSAPIGNVIAIFTADQSLMIPFPYNPLHFEGATPTPPRRSHLSMVK